eukprot:g14904.t1
MDGKYTSLPTQHQDAQWCPRNFLHRHRLVFHVEQRPCETLQALPQDLAEALSQLDATAPRAKEQTTAPGCGVFAATRILPTELYR